jgi:single-stranded-DNA-specific exonuclease
MPIPLKKRWVVREKISPEIDAALGDYSPVMRQMLYNRKVMDSETAEWFLHGTGSMYDPFLLPDMAVAVDRLWYAIDHQEPVAVYGDYDVDGVTATVLLVQVLQQLGANARAYIPNRFDEGYGVNNDALDELANQGVKLVVTVDCGIRSPQEAQHVRQLGLDLIISDHHEPKNDLPEALAVICQKRTGSEYPEKNLAGVGLAFKIAEAMLESRAVPAVQLADWYDLVAVGTVADVVSLTGENRAMVRAGMQSLRFGQRQGLRSLAGVADLNLANTTARDIGFVLGPRLNAAGRLESALVAFDLLMSSDVSITGLLAQKLDNQNRERQRMTQELQVVAESQACIGDDFLLFAVHPEVVQEKDIRGVVGLVAARLTEIYYRPSVVGAQGEEFTRASCRSIPEFHITHALDACDSLLVRHGGHAMAAGFTVRNKDLPELAFRLREIALLELGERDLRPSLKADMVIPLHELRPMLLKELDQLQPTGQDNPDAVFISTNLEVKGYRKIGKESQHLRLTVSDGRITFDAVAFRQGLWADQMPKTVDLAYVFEKNVYNGRESLQLNVRDIRPAGVSE